VILEIQDIHTYYGNSCILQGVSLQMRGGTLIALLGRNGVGKTTLVRSIIGFTPARQGIIKFKGVDITHLTPEEIARLGIGLVPQGYRVFPSLTVHENIMIAARSKGTASWTLEQIFELFPPLKERASNPGRKLSGGEQQMVCIARSLMTNPDLLLMDEPTTGLAPLLLENLIDLLKSFKERGLSVFLVEQNLNFALELADYIYVMSQGKIVFDSHPGELLQNTQIMYHYLGV
jgi:branched-chain amino acid transport system ATP-binding protein